MPFGVEEFHQDKYNPVAGKKCEDAIMSLAQYEGLVVAKGSLSAKKEYLEFLDYIAYFVSSQTDRVESEAQDE
ncbi:hypothetical protein LCGC14_2274550 [marine sediment metagenome]|uniref:Uncharacterized protein n=1 Tax=marine sediment metagenome TaxID=412755 RepID=A0A0F9F8G6_9ZZZZ